MRDKVSFTEQQAFKRCQWRWKLDYLESRRHPIFGIHMDFGTALHGTLEHFKSRKNPIVLSEAIERFEESFDLLYEKNKGKYSTREKDQDPSFFLQAGKNILNRFDECGELASAEVLYNEHELDVIVDRTDGRSIRFKGFIDLVVKTKDKRGKPVLYVCDYKSCSWGWSAEQRRDREKQSQLLLYKHFLCKKFDLDPGDVRTAFILLKKRPAAGGPPVEFFPVSAGPVSVQRAVDSLNSDVSAMRTAESTGVFLKNREACVDKYGETCPYFGTELCPD